MAFSMLFAPPSCPQAVPGDQRRRPAHQAEAAKGRRLVDYDVFLNEVWRPMTRKVASTELGSALKEGLLPPARVSGRMGRLRSGRAPATC